MINRTVEVFYDLTKDGKCPHCKAQIKIVTLTYEIYKVRIVKKYYRDGNRLGKCPECKTIFRIDI